MGQIDCQATVVSDHKKTSSGRMMSAGALVLKVVVWSVLLFVAGDFFYRNAARFLVVAEESYGDYYWARRWWIFAHVAFGSLALLLGPIQFSKSIRTRFIRFHRFIGRSYVFSVAAASVPTFYITWKSEIGWVFSAGLFVLTVVWLTTTAMAVVAVRRQKFDQHREWMVRSYVATYAFVTIRLIVDGLTYFDVATLSDRWNVAGWACWALPLFVTEVAIQLKKI